MSTARTGQASTDQASIRSIATSWGPRDKVLAGAMRRRHDGAAQGAWHAPPARLALLAAMVACAFSATAAAPGPGQPSLQGSSGGGVVVNGAGWGHAQPGSAIVKAAQEAEAASRRRGLLQGASASLDAYVCSAEIPNCQACGAQLLSSTPAAAGASSSPLSPQTTDHTFLLVCYQCAAG